MEPDFQLIKFRGGKFASEADDERGARAVESDREAVARLRAARMAWRDHLSVRNDVMGNDAGWYRAR
jgi:hypothetical protein